jgi:hypothetical protein
MVCRTLPVVLLTQTSYSADDPVSRSTSNFSCEPSQARQE